MRFLLPIVAVLVWGIIIWFSIRATPLADKPYRWATYVGIQTGGAALILLLFSISAFQNGNTWGALSIVIATAFAGLASYGILRRKKFGVVFFIIFYSAVVLFSAMQKQPSNAKPERGFAILIFLIFTIIYFKKRWRFLGKPPSNSILS